MPRPVSQYFSLPFNRHCIRSPPLCLPELCRMPAAIRRRPEERKARAGRHSHPAQLRIRPPRASTSIPHASSAGLRRLQAARIQFGRASHAALCREAGRLVSRYPAGEESGSGKPPGRKPHILPLHPCSAQPCPAASPQRPLPHFPVGKIFCVKGGHAVLSAPAKTFLTGGRVCKDPRATHGAPHARA